MVSCQAVKGQDRGEGDSKRISLRISDKGSTCGRSHAVASNGVIPMSNMYLGCFIDHKQIIKFS